MARPKGSKNKKEIIPVQSPHAFVYETTEEVVVETPYDAEDPKVKSIEKKKLKGHHPITKEPVYK